MNRRPACVSLDVGLPQALNGQFLPLTIGHPSATQSSGTSRDRRASPFLQRIRRHSLAFGTSDDRRSTACPMSCQRAD
jgi:hypothetical protein